ncbi:protein-tyrosine phosphatase family protein [Haloarcula halophila]|uniref:protein-tyrosine phosphatase family protein n=1 Tax=Haloarcula TaxID=2237 RepID=UPI0023E39078|nr:dual specificity protein phosphatase family protein [Halomicroarcula sp. DFY41]
MNAHRFAPAAPDEEFVYGACAPGWHSAGSHADALDDWIETLRDREVTRICCLLPGRQLDTGGSNLDRYRSAFGAENVCHSPVPDHHLVPQQQLSAEILPFLADARRDEERVVVHCLAGIGRTGQVLAAWLVYNRDYGPHRAIETVESMGREPLDAVRAGNAEKADLVEVLADIARVA